MEKIYNASDDITANEILEEMKTQGIQAYVMDSGAGQYMKIVQGFSVYGKDIYVESEAVEKAKEILKNFKKDEKKKHKSYTKKNIVAAVILAISAFMLIVFLIMSNVKAAPEITIDISKKQVMSIQLKNYNKTSEINNRDIIDEIVSNITGLTVKENRWIKIPKNPSGKSDVTVSLYDENKNLIHKVVFSGEDVLYLDDVRCSIIENTYAKKKIKDIMSYCKKTLPELNEGKVLTIDGENVDIKDSEIITEYNKMVDAKPIADEEMKSDSEKTIKITTTFDEVITLFYEENEVYIDYEYDGESAKFMFGMAD